MRRIGIYSGTFDPPHVGHIHASRHALQALDLDCLLVIPDRISPYKQLTDSSASPDQRLEMLRLCFGEDERIRVSDLTYDHPGPSYSFETVARVKALYPDAQLYFLLGTDKFSSLPDWKQAESILANAVIGVFCRGDRGEREKAEALAAGLPGKAVLLDNPVIGISSTQLRRLLVFGAAGPFLEPEVLSYIHRHGLYGTGRSYRGLSLEALQSVVTSLLNPNRVAHVLGCRQAAVELARRYGADETDAARAALLHDITKALDGPLQLTFCQQYGIMLDKFSAQNPKTLHALTGSLAAQRIFGENEAVVSAIRSHTTGKANMNLLEKIIYVADYMEPNRDFPGVERLRSLAFEDMDKALKLGLQMTLDMLRRQGREVSPESVEALSYLEMNGV